MDPDENWERATSLAADIIKRASEPPYEPPDHNDGIALAELVNALDEWLKKGGFPPKAWKASKS